jgi:hypothetical protein
MHHGEGDSCNRTRKGRFAGVLGDEVPTEVVNGERNWSVGGRQFVALDFGLGVDNESTPLKTSERYREYRLHPDA